MKIALITGITGQDGSYLPHDDDQGDVLMATIPDTVNQSVQRFLVAIRQRVQAAYLYGSQVKGTAAELSASWSQSSPEGE